MRMLKIRMDGFGNLVTTAVLTVVLLVAAVSAFSQALYGCDRNGRLFIVDLNTGMGTLQCELPTYPNPGATEIEYEEGTTRAYVQARDGVFSAQAFDVFRCHELGGLVGNGMAFNGLEFVDGVLYGTAIPFQCQPSELMILEPQTGMSTVVGTTGVGPISGLAWDGTGEVMYGITGCSQLGPSELVTIDLSTGAATSVGPTGVTAGSLEFGPDGMLYAGGDNKDGGNLYRVSTVDGSATLVGPTGFGNVTGLTFVNTSLVIADLDVKPTSCPNPINVHLTGDLSPRVKGDVLSVAVLGTADFDVDELDVSTVRLQGVVAPLRFDLEDVSAPVVEGALCECTTEGPDGYVDLTLKFSKAAVAAALGAVEDRDVVPVTLTGFLGDGTIVEATDCILVFLRETGPDVHYSVDELRLYPALPNPFNPVTRIGYVLPGETWVRLDVYDVGGRRIERLLDRIMPAGEHQVVWDASGLPSGVYFYRLEAAGHVAETRKVILLK